MEGPAGRRLALAACASSLLVAATFALALGGGHRDPDGGVAAAGPAPTEPAPTVVAAAAPPEAAAPAEVERVATGNAASRRLVAQVYEVLPGVFLDDADAEELGLRVVRNAFDNEVPPRRDALFTFPLPGQTPASIIVSEFYAAGFVAGHAQSFESRRAGGPRVGAVAWAFATEAGAERAFRALRDLSGRRNEPGSFAPISAVAEDGGISERLWVRGRLLLRVASVVPADQVDEARGLSDRLAAELDARTTAAAVPPGAPPEPVIVAVEPVAERLLTLRVPDLELPGGLNTDPRTLSGNAIFREPSAGVGASGPLLDELTAAGFIAGTVQVVRVAGQPSARFGLTARLFPDGAAARRALDAVVEAGRASRRQRSPLFGGAWLLRGPNGDNYSDLWWVRGPLLLQAGVYSDADVPQRPEVRDDLARLLDARAAAW